MLQEILLAILISSGKQLNPLETAPCLTITRKFRQLETIRGHLRHFRIIWEHLRPFGRISDNFEPFQTIWNHFPLSETMSKQFLCLLDHFRPL